MTEFIGGQWTEETLADLATELKLSGLPEWERYGEHLTALLGEVAELREEVAELREDAGAGRDLATLLHMMDPGDAFGFEHVRDAVREMSDLRQRVQSDDTDWAAFVQRMEEAFEAQEVADVVSAYLRSNDLGGLVKEMGLAAVARSVLA